MEVLEFQTKFLQGLEVYSYSTFQEFNIRFVCHTCKLTAFTMSFFAKVFLYTLILGGVNSES